MENLTHDGFVALAQINFKNGFEKAVGILNGNYHYDFMDNYEYLAKILIANNNNVSYVKMFDNKLNMQGIYYP